MFQNNLANRHFIVQCQDETTALHPNQTTEPQGSVLRLVLYQIYTANIPTLDKTVTATFADDAAILATSTDPLTASNNL